MQTALKSTPGDGVGSGDDVVDGGENKKKRKGQIKKLSSPGPTAVEDDHEDEAVFSGSEEGEDTKPRKRVTKKCVVWDDDKVETVCRTTMEETIICFECTILLLHLTVRAAKVKK
ncbi:hypothetical protein JB92DRAFT_2830188 [Gautieria morchelliformis]|nr:hypothetical protein JB92DRAFT_2830188 [Gautieria morchelliformis]